MRREQRITTKRNGGPWPALLALLLAAVLSLAPPAAVAAPVAHEPGMMQGPCSMPGTMPGDHPTDVDMICAMAGGCVVLPVASPQPATVVPGHVVIAPPSLVIRVGWNQAPEPPPPRPPAA